MNFLGRSTGILEALIYTNELFFLLYQCIALSSHAVDDHQMISTGSVVVKTLLIDSEISPIPHRIFTGGQPRLKVERDQGLDSNTGTLVPAKGRAGCWVRERVTPSRCDGPGVSHPENF